MGSVTLFWEEDFEESFDLIAIHCSEEVFKMAYLLNQITGMKLKRCQKDLDLFQNGQTLYFPIFLYEDNFHHTQYYLIQNKSLLTEEMKNAENPASLFSDDLLSYYLLPHYKKVEFFIKIVHENDHFLVADLVNRIKEIRQVVSVYAMDVSLLKSKNNLIFDLC